MNPIVRHVRPREDYCLELEFENGEHRVFDVRPYLQRGVFARLHNVALFRAARVVAGSVEWPAGIDLGYDTLYVESTPAPAPVTDQIEQMG